MATTYILSRWELPTPERWYLTVEDVAQIHGRDEAVKVRDLFAADADPKQRILYRLRPDPEKEVR